MSKAKFSIGDYIKTVPVSGSDREVITRIPLDDIDPDPCNFYSLEGLDALAANIETVGLLDPLRVRPAAGERAAEGVGPYGKGMRFFVVSGHRRRAALLLIRDGGGEMFREGGRYADGVPCIVEYGEASDAMRELRLIFANSATRVISAAEISKQAERVTELLYELSKQGVEFPGRMRDHVAEACRVSSTKLARLHAIRERLLPELLERFDKGEINESVAYRISREGYLVQGNLAGKLGPAIREVTAADAEAVINQVKTQLFDETSDDAVGATLAVARPEPGATSAGDRKGRPYDAERDGGPPRASAPTEADEDDDDGVAAVSISDLVPRWQTGTPSREGRYFCRLDMGLNKPMEQRCYFRDGEWTAYGRPVSDVGEVVDWWPLPEE